jgi:hypothetical protein
MRSSPKNGRNFVHSGNGVPNRFSIKGALGPPQLRIRKESLRLLSWGMLRPFCKVGFSKGLRSVALWHLHCCFFANLHFYRSDMKLRISILALASTALISLQAQTSTLYITESGESLWANLDGNSFPDIQITPLTGRLPQGSEEWIISLSGGYTFSAAFFGVTIPPVRVGEPAGEQGFNLVGVFALEAFSTEAVGPTQIRWVSDVVGTAGFLPTTLDPNPVTIDGGVVGPQGLPINLVLSDVAATPDSGSTLALAGVGFVAAATFRFKLRK